MVFQTGQSLLADLELSQIDLLVWLESSQRDHLAFSLAFSLGCLALAQVFNQRDLLRLIKVVGQKDLQMVFAPPSYLDP